MQICGAETLLKKVFCPAPYIPKTFDGIAFIVPVKTIPIFFAIISKFMFPPEA